MPALVGVMAGLVDGIDVASGGELKVALDAGADPEEISFAGPGKRRGELTPGGRGGRPDQHRIVPRSQRTGRDFRGVGAAGARRGAGQPRLRAEGLGHEDGRRTQAVRRRCRTGAGLAGRDRPQGTAFEGFHLFAGSQNLRADSICEAQQKSYELALRLAADAPAPVRFLNLGGGFGIPYFPGENRLDLAPIGENLARLTQRAATEMPTAQLVIELGRYLVGEAGIYVAGSSTARFRADRCFWWSTAGCITICPRPATSAR